MRRPLPRTAEPRSQAAVSRPGAGLSRHRARQGGFTLIELIIVMLLLAIAAGMVAPRMSSFFRGRALNLEARRLLSLTQYAQSRAVAEGVPVILWIDARTSRYGVHVQAGHDDEGDDRAVTYTAEPTITLQPTGQSSPPTSEQGDEAFGLPEGMAVIRFNPEGYFDEVSVPKVVLQQSEGAALELVQRENRLGYEIRNATPN